VQIFTDFVILETPEDDNYLSISFGRPFFNATWAIIDCTKSKVTFTVKGKDHTIHFPKNTSKNLIKKSVNTINVITLTIESFKIPIPPPTPKYEILMIGTIPLKMEVN
jgi:hypothetical protein